MGAAVKGVGGAVFMEHTGSEALLDALPYVDPLPEDAELRAAVKREMEKELKSSDRRPQDYLAELADGPQLTFEDSTFLATEFKRIRAGQPPIKFSSRRAKVPVPTELEDVEGWDAALKAAQAEYGYERLRVVHLQLLKKYGKDAWIAHNELVAHSGEVVSREEEETKIAVNEVNLFRQREHQRAGRRLAAAEAKYWELVERSDAVQAALKRPRPQ